MLPHSAFLPRDILPASPSSLANQVCRFTHMNSVHDIPNTGIIAVFAFIFYLFIYCLFLGQIHSQISCPSSHHPQGRSVGSRFVSAWVLLELVCLLEHCLSSWVVSWARVPVSPLLTLKWSQNSTSPCSRTEQPLNTKIPRVEKGSCLLVILVCLWCALLLD